MIQFPMSHSDSSYTIQSSDNISSQGSNQTLGKENNDNYGIQINVNKLNYSSGKNIKIKIKFIELSTMNKGNFTEKGNSQFNSNNGQLKYTIQENLPSSKISLNCIAPEQEFKQWKKQTLKRFVFHLKKLNKRNKDNFLNIKN